MNIPDCLKKLLCAASGLLVSIAAGVFPDPAAAAAESVFRPDDGWFGDFRTLTLDWENDAFANTDHDYTNGFILSLSTPYGTSPNPTVPTWSTAIFEHLPGHGIPGTRQAVSLGIGQDIYNPIAIETAELLQDARPYAGYSYLMARFHVLRPYFKDLWQFSIGVVGPLSLAEDIQRLVHRATGAQRPRGWDHQLNNELTLNAAFERQWRLWSYTGPGAFGGDLIPHLGIRLGTPLTALDTGIQFRIGWQLPRDFGRCPIHGGCGDRPVLIDRDHSGHSIYLFLGVNGQAVAHNLFLDGNTWTDSHSVDKRYLVGEWMAGLSWQAGPARITWAYISRSRQFTTQPEPHAYGSLRISWTY